MTMYRVPYGKSEIEFELPAGMKGTVAVSKSKPPVKDVPAAVKAALEKPVNSRPMQQLVKRGDKVCIVFTDATRASPDHQLVPPMLAELELAGVRDEDITLLCGVGMHRPSSLEEKIAKLGKTVVDRHHVVDNEPQNPDVLVDLGTTKSGIPLSVNKIAYEADLLVATGIVEPHQYAGYSGGAKTVAVGAAGEAMIAYTHGPNMIDHPGTRLGRIEGNPFQEAVSEAGRRAGLRFIINVVMDDEKRILAVRAGEPRETFKELVAFAKSVYEVPVPQQYDVAICGVGYPKDANLYQASRAPSYLFFAPISVVKPGGVFILPAECEEGAGQGVGEQRYLEKMKNARDIPSLLAELRRTGYPPGAQRAFVMAKVLEQNEVIVVGSDDPKIVVDAKMTPARDMDDAFRIAAKKLGSKLDVLVVPHALLTLPIVRSAA
jgi:nickel-dependent lactate racemase